MPGHHGTPMPMLAKPLLCLCLGAVVLPAHAVAHPGGAAQDTPDKRRARAQGMPVREIERRVIPRVPGAQYLGFDYDPSTDIYTLKFLRNGSVIWVDVDGRSGNIVRRTGN